MFKCAGRLVHLLPFHTWRTAENELEEEAREQLLASFRVHGRKGGAADQVRLIT